MSIAINPDYAPVPVTGAQVLLNLKNGGRVVTQLDDMSQHFWTLQVRSAPPGALVNGLVANISYADSTHLYNGACKVQSLALGGRRVVIKKPNWFESRPVRRFERYALDLPTALLVQDGDYTHYIQRSDARILNISEGGVLLALRQPLPTKNKRVLLLADTAMVTGGAGGHAYFAAKVVRFEQQAPTNQFSYRCGLSFGQMPPLYRQILDLVIDRASEGKARQANFKL